MPSAPSSLSRLMICQKLFSSMTVCTLLQPSVARGMTVGLFTPGRPSFAGWLLVIKAILDLILYIQLKKKLDVALAMQAQKTKKTESYAMATVEPQRPAAPSFWQKREQKKQEKEAARAKAREAARLREEQERAERNRRAQEQERAEEEEVFAGTNAMHDASTEEPMDADFAQTEATEHEVGGSEPIYDAHYTEADVDEDGEEG